LLTDGDVLLATAWTHSLSVLRTEGAVVVASEPSDARPGWTPVPERHAVRARRGAVEFVPIEGNQERSTRPL
jgi:glutamine amidotransferase